MQTNCQIRLKQTVSETCDCYPTDLILWDDVAALELSLQTLKALSGDELYIYYRLELEDIE
jgi:hypothetical protein